jgi:sugar lactone lactonase YvrE
MKNYRYDFDPETGSISNRTVLRERQVGDGEPDGQVIEFVLFP